MSSDVAVRVNEVMQIALTVNDLAQAKHFYGEVLGMPFLFDAGNMAFFQCGGVRLLIGTGETKPNHGTLVYFRVADLEATRRGLRDRGVEFAQEPQMIARMPDHELWLAYVQDPSGNLLGLMEERRP